MVNFPSLGNHQCGRNFGPASAPMMWGFVVLLAVWMSYVETEMPNRTNECPYADLQCKVVEEQD